MTRTELMQAVREAAAIIEEAIPMPSNSPAIAEDRQQLRVALAPAVLRELLTNGVEIAKSVR
jgi:hypothetical protein